MPRALAWRQRSVRRSATRPHPEHGHPASSSRSRKPRRYFQPSRLICLGNRDLSRVLPARSGSEAAAEGLTRLLHGQTTPRYSLPSSTGNSLVSPNHHHHHHKKSCSPLAITLDRRDEQSHRCSTFWQHFPLEDGQHPRDEPALAPQRGEFPGCSAESRELGCPCLTRAPWGGRAPPTRGLAPGRVGSSSASTAGKGARAREPCR